MKKDEKNGMREILTVVTHDFNLIDNGYEITSLDIFKFIEIINTCLTIGWGETKKIKVIISTCRVTDERTNPGFGDKTLKKQVTNPRWGGGKRSRRKRSRATKKHKTRKHK